MTETFADRARGALLGLAAGDALGTTLEFARPGSFEPIHDMIGGGTFDLQPGQWTDDTSMALCLAESLAERGGFDAADQMTRYLRWRREGYHSSTDRCFDIGNATNTALGRFEATGDPWAGSTDPRRAGNGSIMRLAPVAIRYAFDIDEAMARAADSSCTTHGAPTTIDACRYLAWLLIGALQGRPKIELLADPGLELHPEIAAIAAGSFRHRNPPEIRGGGFVVHSLEAALWAFVRSDDFDEGALLAVNLGDDADTTGAVYGQLAGAFYGAEAIPRRWRDCLSQSALITALADALAAACATGQAQLPATPLRVTGPLGRSYWAAPGRLLAGVYPGAPTRGEAADKLTALLDAGVRTFVDLTEAGEGNHDGQPLEPYGRLAMQLAAERGLPLRCMRTPIRDMDVCDAETMVCILGRIDDELRLGRTVYVHCWGGYGRTGMVVGCWLAQQGVATGEAALERLTQLRRDEATAHRESPQTEAQRDLVRRWPLRS